MTFLRGHDQGVADLVTAMGLPTKHLHRVVIDMAVGDVVRVTTYGYATTDDIAKATELVSEYRLTKRKPKAAK